MSLYPVHRFFIHNTKICSVSDFIASENEGGIYEVLRLVEGIPLFWEDYFQRLLNSAKIAGVEFFSAIKLVFIT